MADDDVHTSTDTPLASLAAAEAEIEPRSEPVPEASAAERLRAFEDEHLGKDAVRLHGGRVERGSGSLYQKMAPELRKVHELLEKAVGTEATLIQARAAVSVAEGEHAAALAAVDNQKSEG